MVMVVFQRSLCVGRFGPLLNDVHDGLSLLKENVKPLLMRIPEVQPSNFWGSNT